MHDTNFDDLIFLFENISKNNPMKLDGSDSHRFIETKSRRTKAQHSLEMFPVVSKELTGRCVHFEFVVSENTAKYSLIFFNRLSCILSA